MPTATLYRIAFADGIAFLALFILAFGSLTILGRQAWSALGTRESLLGRLAGAAVLAGLALAGVSSFVDRLFFSVAFQPGEGAIADLAQIEAARNQVVVAFLLGLLLAAGAVVWIETAHRRAIGVLTARKGEDEEWSLEEPKRADGH